MVNRNLIRSLEDDTIYQQIADLLPEEKIHEWLDPDMGEAQDFGINQIVAGKIVEVTEDFVVVDVGFKSEGAIDRNEWSDTDEQPVVGGIVKVLVEEMEDELGPADDIHGMISLSKRKAEKIIQWEGADSLNQKKARLLPVRSPARSKAVCWSTSACPCSSRPARSTFAVPTISPISSVALSSAKFFKIDESRRNIVVSRRSLDREAA